uniref:Uncharacterized protein n=1 Tax=Chenopodium quinoa TaxID=63459 RepID=A0A803N4P1_CHEQI
MNGKEVGLGVVVWDSNAREAYTSSTLKGRCFCLTNITDVCPRPFDIDDVYGQFEFFKTDCCMLVAESIAPDAYPPELLRTLGSQMKPKSPKKLYIREARGIDSSLRANLPDFNFLPSQESSESVVVGKWYCPFMFIKDGKRKDQIKANVFYKMTLEQRWERIFAAERSYSQGKKVTVDVVVPTVTVKISERIMWEQERVGWIKDKEQRVRVVKDEIYEGIGYWKSFSSYVLVESSVLKLCDAAMLCSPKPTSYRLKQNKLDKINVLRTEAEANESIPGNHDTSKPPVYEESRQNVDIEQAGTKNHTIRDKSSQRLKKVTTLTPADKDDNKVSTVIEDQREKLIPGEVQIMHQITEKDVQEECDNNSCNQQQKHQEPIKMVKQEPLTEDELLLK